MHTGAGEVPMAVLTVQAGSRALQQAVTFGVIAPEGEGATSPAVLYLFHGLGDSYAAWGEYTSIVRYANRYNLLVVMPEVGRSFYTNMESGPRYFDFIRDDLPRLVKKLFGVAPPRERSFVAGLSMGGYGALKLGLCAPERFAAVASFSGALDVAARYDDARARSEAASLTPAAAPGGWDAIQAFREMVAIFGDPPRIEGTVRDLFHQADALADEWKRSLAITLVCGEQDFLLGDNEGWVSHARKAGLMVDYRTRPGDHEWGFWDRCIEDFLDDLARQGRLD